MEIMETLVTLPVVPVTIPTTDKTGQEWEYASLEKLNHQDTNMLNNDNIMNNDNEIDEIMILCDMGA